MILYGSVKKEPPKYPEFSKRIKAARKAKRIAISDMAERTGVDWFTYLKIDTGDIYPDDQTLTKINQILFGEEGLE